MKKIVITFLNILFIPLALSANSNIFIMQNSIRSEIYKKIIPERVISFIRKELPDWQFPSPDLWDEKIFNDYASKNSLAYYVTGDFNGDHKPDYVVLLTNANKQYSTWVLMSSDNELKKTRIQFNTYSTKINFVLGVLHPGFYNSQVSDVTLDPIHVKNDALKIIYNSGDIGVSYWNDEKRRGFILKDIEL